MSRDMILESAYSEFFRITLVQNFSLEEIFIHTHLNRGNTNHEQG